MIELPRRVLLTEGSAYGTLATARYFGRSGYRVVVADSTGLRTTTQRSVFVHETLRCPDRLDFADTVRWLEDFGRRRPGFLLYPCTDDLAWIIAGARSRLEPYFALCAPSFGSIETLLNKRKLYDLCTRLGIPTPFSVYPRDLVDLVALARSLRGQFLIKPKTQVGHEVRHKAVPSSGGQALIDTYVRFRRQSRYAAPVRCHDPSLTWPMIQEFNPWAATRTLSVAGFRSPDGKEFHALSSRKALQYPLAIGIGMCFESVPNVPSLVDHVRRICAATGYFGAFEVEFLPSSDHYELMDFNPRFYGHMQLEISRGLPIPGLVAAAAGVGESPDHQVVDRAGWRLANRSQLRLVMTTQWMSGHVGWSERARWLRFAHGREPSCVDHVYDPGDRVPWLTDLVLRNAHYCRHPRYAFRTLFGSG